VEFDGDDRAEVAVTNGGDGVEVGFGPDRLPMSAAVENAALLVHRTMVLIRTIRYAALAGRVPLSEFCAAFGGAGLALRSADRQPWRDQAFRRLTAQWLERSPQLAAEVLRGPGRRREQAETSALPDKAQLTLAGYTAGNPAEAVVNLAVPRDDGTWGLWSALYREPERLTMSTAAFLDPSPVTRDGSLVLGDFALASGRIDGSSPG
jgi:hypothetical protein